APARHRVRRGPQAASFARAARARREIALRLLLVRARQRALLDRGDHAPVLPLPARRALVLLPVPVEFVLEALLARPFEHDLLRALRELLPGRIEVEAVGLGDLLEEREVG